MKVLVHTEPISRQIRKLLIDSGFAPVKVKDVATVKILDAEAQVCRQTPYSYQH